MLHLHTQMLQLYIIFIPEEGLNNGISLIEYIFWSYQQAHATLLLKVRMFPLLICHYPKWNSQNFIRIVELHSNADCITSLYHLFSRFFFWDLMHSSLSQCITGFYLPKCNFLSWAKMGDFSLSDSYFGACWLI